MKGFRDYINLLTNLPSEKKYSVYLIVFSKNAIDQISAHRERIA